MKKLFLALTVAALLGGASMQAMDPQQDDVTETERVTKRMWKKIKYLPYAAREEARKALKKIDQAAADASGKIILHILKKNAPKRWR